MFPLRNPNEAVFNRIGDTAFCCLASAVLRGHYTSTISSSGQSDFSSGPYVPQLIYRLTSSNESFHEPHAYFFSKNANTMKKIGLRITIYLPTFILIFMH